ncbi:MAG: DUF308 domain-containing protein [Promethearchaeia archaeon]
MSEKSETKAVNSSNILNGLIIMILAIIIFFYPNSTLIFLIYIFTVVILISGISRVYNSFNNQKLSNLGKATKFTSGFVLIILSLVIFLITLSDPAFSTELLILLIIIGLIVIGFARIGTGIVNKKYIKWFRVFLIIIGAITLVLNLISFYLKDTDPITVIFFIAITLFINGFTRFLYGLTGKEKFSEKIQ